MNFLSVMKSGVLDHFWSRNTSNVGETGACLEEYVNLNDEVQQMMPMGRRIKESIQR
jgi:hypothetical protein